MICLTSIRDVGKFFMFIVVGLATIIVGSFMIRGNMHMWDKSNHDSDSTEDKNSVK